MTFTRNLRFAVRRLYKTPLFTLTAILGVAAGIGINTAVFAVVNGLVLRPLPYQDPDRLVMVVGTHPQIARFSTSYPDFADWKERSKSFEHLVAFQQRGFTVAGNESPEKFRGLIVSADFFPMLGVKPAIGRVFTPAEEMGAGPPVAVLSHALWRDWFSSDKNIVGHAVTIDSVSYTVIGVMPANFLPPVGGRFWVPLTVSEDAKADRGQRYLRVLGKLKPGVTIEEAQAELTLITGQLGQQYASTNAGRMAQVISLQSELTKTDRLPLLLTLGAVAFVLLITCLNLANLFMARALSRGKEVATSIALGASRSNVVMQFMTESMLLALCGASLGLLFSMWARDIIVASLAVSPLFKTNIDSRILLFAVGITLLTGFASGLIPALRISRVDPLHALKGGGAWGSTGGRGNLLKNLVSAEVGLALTLTIGAILMYKSLAMLQQTELGYNPDNLVATIISIPEREYDSPEKQIGFYKEVVERVDALPGEQTASLVSIVPLIGTTEAAKVNIEGEAATSDKQVNRAGFHVVSPSYFEAMKIPFVSGRLFSELDVKGSPKVAVVSRKMASLYWPDQDPINRRFATADEPDSWITVVGVVGDAKYAGLSAEPTPEFYLPFAQEPRTDMAVLVRSSNPAVLMKEIRKVVQSVNRNQPVDRVATMDELIDEQLGKSRSLANVIGLFGVTALLLAALGIYGITSYSVRQRTHEIGIRMALGARRINVVSLIVRQSLLYVLIGVAAGVVGAVFLARTISSLLYGVQPLDLGTYVVASLILTLTGLLASIIPARRASLVEPSAALKHE